MDSDPPAPHMHREVTTLGKKTVIYAVSMKNPWNAVAWRPSDNEWQMDFKSNLITHLTAVAKEEALSIFFVQQWCLPVFNNSLPTR